MRIQRTRPYARARFETARGQRFLRRGRTTIAHTDAVCTTITARSRHSNAHVRHTRLVVRRRLLCRLGCGVLHH